MSLSEIETLFNIDPISTANFFFLQYFEGILATDEYEDKTMRCHFERMMCQRNSISLLFLTVVMDAIELREVSMP